MKRVRVRIPSRLPELRPSHVSYRRGRFTVHSLKSTRKLNSMEKHRRRRNERKWRKRMARHGQIESMSHDYYGMSKAAADAGLTVSQIADTAMVSRALKNGGY